MAFHWNHIAIYIHKLCMCVILKDKDSNHINFVSLREILSPAITKYTCIQTSLQWLTVGKRLINLHIGFNTHIQPCNFSEAFREYNYIHIHVCFACWWLCLSYLCHHYCHWKSHCHVLTGTDSSASQDHDGLLDGPLPSSVKKSTTSPTHSHASVGKFTFLVLNIGVIWPSHHTDFVQYISFLCQFQNESLQVLHAHAWHSCVPSCLWSLCCWLLWW